MANDLTERQEQVLGVITKYFEDHGHAPSYRDIALGIGVRSTNAVNDHIVMLESKGYLTRRRREDDSPAHIARSIQLTKKAKR